MTSFSVAGWSHIDHCGTCGDELPTGPLTRAAPSAPERAGTRPLLADAIVALRARRRRFGGPRDPNSERSSNGTVRATS
jgi:hypothetical protein